MLPTQNNITQDKKLVKEAVKKFLDSDFSDGEIVSMHWLKEFLDIKEATKIEQVTDFQWELLTKMEMFKDELLNKHQIALKNVRGSGYMIVPPGQQALYAAEIGIKTFNKGMKKTEKLLDNVRLAQMDNDEKRILTDAQVKFSALKGMLNKQRISIFLTFKDKKRLEDK